MQLKKKPAHTMKVLLAAKGREQSDMWKTFVMSEGVVEKHITVTHPIEECMKLVKENHFDILVVGLELEDERGATFIQRVRSLEAYQFTPIIVAGNITPEDICILFEQGVKHIASKPVTYDGFSEKYKQMVQFEQNLPEKELLCRKARAFMKQGNLQMAEKAFEKLEGMTFGEEPDVGQALLGTDLFIMKGDTKNAEAQLMLLKGSVEKNPLYQALYDHRENSFKLMNIKKDMIEHNWTEGDMSADASADKWTEGDLSQDPSKTPGAEVGVKGETKDIGTESGVPDEQRDIGVETGVKGKEKNIGTETGVAGENKAVGVASGVASETGSIGAETGVANQKQDIGVESGVKGPNKKSKAELGEKIEELRKLRENMQALVDQNANNAVFAESMAEIDRTAGDIEHAMEMYQKVLDVNPENEKAKIQYSDVAFEADRMDNFRDYIYEQVDKDPNYEVSLDFIREMNKKAVAYINNKENQRFKEGVQIYEDLLSWINKSSEELREIRAKIWFNLATAYQKAPKPNPEQRKRALISGYRESPEGSAIQDKVLNVINRDYDGLVA